MLPSLIFLGVSSIAVGYVAYVLWPRWPGPAVAPNAPSLPIIVGGTAFNVPPAAIRRPVQRKPGTQERIDLVFVWPSLAPPANAAEAGPQGASASAEAAHPFERIFLAIAAGDGGPSPLQRMQTIYRRYLAPETLSAPSGLIMLAFRKDTPYQRRGHALHAGHAGALHSALYARRIGADARHLPARAAHRRRRYHRAFSARLAMRTGPAWPTGSIA